MIDSFDYMIVGDNITFEGHVVDDQAVGGLMVRFGGVLSTYAVSVSANGSFSLNLAYDPVLLVGTVSAQTTDAQGNNSNTPEVML